jgi:hypothetical protein
MLPRQKIVTVTSRIDQRLELPVLPLLVAEPGVPLLAGFAPVLLLPLPVAPLLSDVPVPPLPVAPPELLPLPAIPLVAPVPVVLLELEFPVVELALPEGAVPLPLLLAPELGRAASFASCRPHAVNESARATPSAIQCLLMGEFLMVTYRRYDSAPCRIAPDCVTQLPCPEAKTWCRAIKIQMRADR